jgi:hypothetical protein
MCIPFEAPEPAQTAEEDAELALLLEVTWNDICSEQIAVSRQ